MIKHPTIPSDLNEKVGEDFVPDDFRHEQYLLIEENGKRVLISGCSHKGSKRACILSHHIFYLSLHGIEAI